MSRFRCTICGYAYDSAVGIPEMNIAPHTKWEDIPDDFVCPLCGAPKDAFEEDVEIEIKISTSNEILSIEEDEPLEDLRELSAGELSALCSNLAKGCQKQHLSEEEVLFNQLADYYNRKIPSVEEEMDGISNKLKKDLSDGYPLANAESKAAADRGALRALVWGEKVSIMLNSLLNRYQKEGDAILEKTKIYVCDICGFVYLGDNLPEICPVCKVPNFKILQVGRG